MNSFNDDIFVIGCYPNSEEKKNQVLKMIKTLEKYKKPIVVVSHYPITEEIMKLVDFVIYDKRNIVMPHPMVQWYTAKLVNLVTQYATNYYLAAYMSLKNASSFLRHRYSFVHYIDYDVDADFDSYLNYVNLARSEGKKFVSFHYDGPKTTSLSIHSYDSKWFNKNFVDVNSWKEWEDINANFEEITGIISFLGSTIEHWFFIYLAGMNILDQCYFLSDDIKGKIIRSFSTINTSEDKYHVRILVSETNEHKQIVFFINTTEKDEMAEIQFRNEKKIINIPSRSLFNGELSYYLFDNKEDLIKVITSDRDIILDFSEFSPLYSVFKFHDNRIICNSNKDGGMWNALIQLPIKEF
jgi:hypothetical protein